MIKQLAVMIALILTTGCAIPSSYQSNGYPVDRIEMPSTWSMGVGVDYVDRDMLIQREQKKAALAFSEADLSNIHPYITVSLSTPTIGSANTKWWRVIIKDEIGNVVVDKTGNSRIARYETNAGITTWKNTMIVPIGDLEPPFDVYVIENISDNRWGFRIDEAGK